MQAVDNLLELPPELVAYVLRMIPFRRLMLSCTVSRAWFNLCETEPSLREFQYCRSTVCSGWFVVHKSNKPIGFMSRLLSKRHFVTVTPRQLNIYTNDRKNCLLQVVPLNNSVYVGQEAIYTNELRLYLPTTSSYRPSESKWRHALLVKNAYRKILVVGHVNTGKSCLVERWATGELTNEKRVYKPTIGASCRTNIFHFEIDGERYMAKWKIWDLSGDFAFKEPSILSSYKDGAAGIVHVFDVSNKDSFDSTKELLQLFHINRPTILIGNKIDTPKIKRCVPRDEAEALATKYNATYFETSTWNNTNVKKSMKKLEQMIESTIR